MMCFLFPDGSENVTGLDLSDFPALADRSRRDGSSNSAPQHNPLAGRAPYGNTTTSLSVSNVLVPVDVCKCLLNSTDYLYGFYLQSAW